MGRKPLKFRIALVRTLFWSISDQNPGEMGLNPVKVKEFFFTLHGPHFLAEVIQSNLFITDTKGTGISVRIIEVSVLER